ncbi:glycosyltransferase [Acinetobacter sp. 809848]|jgi:poly(glycerol-phosphate) alpha-glucosyltransferase|uniref:glycosyltransferase n=1 Tax=Acinetobacter sp. 809848 TaxID=1310637 RepID=UPI0004493CA6|nr:glycosyltransferase [Acinetobacter sp. 809848]EXC25781.1 glycosyl transferases group 1 family protein [Acinetobacter sp. 809848]
MLKEKGIYMLYPAIKQEKNGLLIALIKRADLFSRNGIKVNICTLSYNPMVNLLYKDLYTSRLLDSDVSKNINFFNLYSYYQKSEFSIDFNPEDSSKITIEEENIESDSLGNIKVFDTRNKLCKYYVKNKQGLLSHINIFESGKIVKRLKFNEKGILSSSQVLDSNRLIVAEDFYDINNHLVLSRNYNKEGKVISLYLYEVGGIISRKFSSEIELFEYTISKLNEDEHKVYIIDRAIVFAKNILLNKKKNSTVIGIIHAAHYSKAREKDSKANAHYKSYIENLEKIDHLIFLTEKQKNHFGERFGFYPNYTVIPHFYRKTTFEDSLNSRQKYKCVCLARFDKVKRLDLLIELFSDVHRKIPEATLDIYGFGPEKENLIKTIENKNLVGVVRLRDFVSDINSVLKNADLMLFTSGSEGFCMAILDSLKNGCPVISFDIDYGPSEMIVNDYNGYLVEDNDTEKFINTTIELLNNREKISLFHKNCAKSVWRFNDENNFKLWENIIFK